MKANLTFKEKRFAQQFINSSSELEASSWPEWAPWVLYALGGFLAVSVGFMFIENPSAFTKKYVLFPGIAIGMALSLFGVFIQHMSTKSEEHKFLTSMLRKLISSDDN